MQGCTARLVSLAFERQGRWRHSAIGELERLARRKGSLMAGSPREAANVATASLARWRRWLSVVLQRGNAAMVRTALANHNRRRLMRICSRVSARFTWKKVPADRLLSRARGQVCD